jgi:hypothetical protein
MGRDTLGLDPKKFKVIWWNNVDCDIIEIKKVLDKERQK